MKIYLPQRQVHSILFYKSLVTDDCYVGDSDRLLGEGKRKNKTRLKYWSLYCFIPSVFIEIVEIHENQHDMRGRFADTGKEY